jgi:hypothetical protein
MVVDVVVAGTVVVSGTVVVVEDVVVDDSQPAVVGRSLHRVGLGVIDGTVGKTTVGKTTVGRGRVIERAVVVVVGNDAGETLDSKLLC